MDLPKVMSIRDLKKKLQLEDDDTEVADEIGLDFQTGHGQRKSLKTKVTGKR